MRLVIKYGLFAGIATMVNLLFQDLTLRMYHLNYQISVSIMIGTIAGLAVKYILDKKYIFKYQTKNLGHNSKTFILYCAMGLVTTAIFWGFEASFEMMFHTKSMRYLGGAIGLGIGYVAKYTLDKKFVFKHRSDQA